jgi:hypothetical protein
MQMGMGIDETRRPCGRLPGGDIFIRRASWRALFPTGAGLIALDPLFTTTLVLGGEENPELIDSEKAVAVLSIFSKFPGWPRNSSRDTFLSPSASSLSTTLAGF